MSTLSMYKKVSLDDREVETEEEMTFDSDEALLLFMFNMKKENEVDLFNLYKVEP